MKKHPTHKSESGFTLIEMLIAIAIIGILASVAIPQYNQYKIRGYDAQTKQALKNMHMLCNAYWLDTSTLQGCDLSKIKEAAYGFNQNADVVATLPSLPQESFCASAKHNDSPNTFSIDSAALISSGSGCSGANGASTTVQTFESYKPPEIASQETGIWMVVDSEGKQVKGSGGMVCDYSVCGPDGSFYNANPWGMYSSGTVESNGHKMIYEAPTNKGSMAGNYQASGNSQDQMTYNFKTNTWTRGDGATRDLTGNYVQ